LSFNGCDCYEFGDAYQFSHDFDEWWEKELAKRIPDSAAFVKKHGTGWALSLAFRAPKGRRKPNLLGPFNDRYTKWRAWYIELPSFRYKSPDPKTYVPLLRQVLDQLAIVPEREEIDATKLRKDSELLLKRFASKQFNTPALPVVQKSEKITAERMVVVKQRRAELDRQIETLLSPEQLSTSRQSNPVCTLSTHTMAA
jgi:hypothetical protein